MGSRARLVLGLVCLFGGGCLERESQALSPCTQSSVARDIAIENVDRVDLLFLVDNSNSMALEQESLRRELPLMIRILASGDFDQDGSLDGPDDFEPVKNLNVAIISSDMGTAGFDVPTCDGGDLGNDFGDDGLLRSDGNTSVTGCMATYPDVLNFQSGPEADPDGFAFDVGCVARLGTGGCGFEQQLEAMLKALTPTAEQPWTSPTFASIGSTRAANGLERPFYMNSQPHGDRESEGFLRENAVLAIIPVTDEEDCSARDTQIFNPNGGPFADTDLNERCYSEEAGEAALHPVSRYVEGLLQLRAHPGLLIYAPITGIPLDLVPQTGEQADWSAILDDPRMQYRIDRSLDNPIVPSCTSTSGDAYPPRRIVQVARELAARGAHVTGQSICQAGFTDALREIIRQISSALTTACLPRPLNREADGSVGCDVLVTLPTAGDATAACREVGATPRVDSDGQPLFDRDRPICVIPQIVPEDRSPGDGAPGGTGWYYDDFTAERAMNCGEDGDPRIAFAGMEPPTGSVVRLECFVSVDGGEGEVHIGTFCDPMADTGPANLCAEGRTPSANDPEGAALTCDPVERVCGVRCTADADCRTAGLTGFVCDQRSLEEIDQVEFGGNDAPHLFCVNPTCD